MTRSSKSRTIVAGGLALLVALSGALACSKPASTDAAAGTGAPAAAAAPARGADGGETPQAVVDRMKKAAESKNFAEVAACLSPKARQEMSAAMYLGATMMVAFSQMGSQMGGAMMEGMSAMGGETSEADKQKAKEQMEKTQKELAGLTEKYNAVMTKHGLPQLPKEGEAQPPEMSKEEMDKIFAKIDHGVFIAEVMALLESMPGDKKPDQGGPFELKDATLADLKIDGDKASGKAGGEAMNFVQVDGRWFIDADMMGGPGGPGGPGEAGAGEATAAPTN